MPNTFGRPSIFGIEISKARPATSRSDNQPLLYEASLDEGSIYAGTSTQDNITPSNPEEEIDDDEPHAEPPRKSKDLEHFLGLPMRNIATAREEISVQRSAVGSKGAEATPRKSKKWMMSSRTRIAAKKERLVSRAKKMMQQNVLRRHSFGNQI